RSSSFMAEKLSASYSHPQDFTDDYGQVAKARFADACDAACLAVAEANMRHDSNRCPPPNLQVGEFRYVKLANPGEDRYHLDHQPSYPIGTLAHFPWFAASLHQGFNLVSRHTYNGDHNSTLNSSSRCHWEPEFRLHLVSWYRTE
ncbi:MAG: hypothetical protein ACRERD_12700, partial [Candidatus Binatia bacterium]